MNTDGHGERRDLASVGSGHGDPLRRRHYESAHDDATTSLSTTTRYVPAISPGFVRAQPMPGAVPCRGTAPWDDGDADPARAPAGDREGGREGWLAIGPLCRLGGGGGRGG